MIIRCPNCNGDIDVKSETAILICPYCKTNIYFDKKGLFLIEGIKPILDLPAAKEILKNETGETMELSPVHIPFYRFEKDDEAKFIPGVKTPFPGLQFFSPQGDRYPLKEQHPPPEIDIKTAMAKLKLTGYAAAALIYTPFLSGKGKSQDVLIDGVTGKVFKKIKQKAGVKKKGIREPISLLAFGISGIIALTVPGKLLKLILAILFPLIWFIKKRLDNG